MERQEPVTDTEILFAEKLAQWLNETLLSWGVSENLVNVAKLIILLSFAVVIVVLLLFIARKIIRFIIERAHKLTKLSILKYLIENKVPYYIGLLAPYTFVRNVIPVVFADYKDLINPLIKCADIYLVLLVIWLIVAVVKSFFNLLQERPAFAHKPMKSYVQVISIILYGMGIVVMFAIITGTNPAAIIAGLGAASAVMMLVFQDSIKGFVGSIQMTANNMVELGDWITMNKYGADGTVMEVNLSTVKVQNFDKTITTIPTYALISDSFQNWRGMQKSGGRRTKKCIFIKQGTIRFMQEEELKKFREIDYLREVIEAKEKQYNTFDRTLVNNAVPVTNNDLFMAYAMHYLRNHKRVAQDMTLLVRQLAPTTEGIPVEIYIFTATTVWAEYEDIATDIINHLIAMVPVFDLKLFEMLSDTAENPG